MNIRRLARLARPYIALATDQSHSCLDVRVPISSSHSCSISTDACKPLLIRDYIQQSLYHPEQGYFSSEAPPVGRLQEGIQFNRIVGETEYKVHLQRLYKELGVAWLTPAEIFKPWYGYALARYILEYHKHVLQQSSPLTIYEIGGGTGTLATNVLDYLRHVAPSTYEQTTYTCIEISPTLAQLQHHNASEQAGHQHQMQVVQGSGWDPTSWGPPQQQHCFVLMMEVLDNLPHDRVVRTGSDSPWQQTVAVPSGDPHSSSCTWQQQLQPATDPLILRCLEAYTATQHSRQQAPPTASDSTRSLLQKLLDFAAGVDAGAQQQEEVVWLPTACLSLLDCIAAARPSHTLLAADFDALPNVQVQGHNAPLVSGKVGSRREDRSSIFVPWGSADIFFPTDFDLMAEMYRQAVARAQQQQQQQQQQQHGNDASSEAATTTPSIEEVTAKAADASSGEEEQQQQQQEQQQEEEQQQQQQQEEEQQEQQEEEQQQQQAVTISASHTSQAQFMDQLADKKATRTISGYDPLRKDFVNTRMFIGTCRQQSSGSS